MATVDEDALIKSRPLTVEERPFKRLTKRCASLPFPPALPATIPPSAISRSPSRPPTPRALTETDFHNFREDIELDFEYFELTIARIQLLQDTNRREIERYEQEKLNILAASEKARHDMTLLREALQQARQEKDNKLKYDSIASEILSTRALRPPRDEQLLNIARLNQEIAELEEERRSYGKVWLARREQFGEIVRQLEKMQEQIQEDKEEHDRREGMDEEEGEEGEEIENPPPSTITSMTTTAAAVNVSNNTLHASVSSQNLRVISTGGSDATTPAASVSLSTFTSTAQTPAPETPARQSKDVVMTDVGKGPAGDGDKMDTT
ncbi:Tho complex subunit 7-domain-containing protein [Kalaharituber pfeilii]|nr:Tho complex subunit 7-domain-containing protein [Kalaharituber pfeilii]